jgi:hypothetical protein
MSFSAQDAEDVTRRTVSAPLALADDDDDTGEAAAAAAAVAAAALVRSVPAPARVSAVKKHLAAIEAVLDEEKKRELAEAKDASVKRCVRACARCWCVLCVPARARASHFGLFGPARARTCAGGVHVVFLCACVCVCVRAWACAHGCASACGSAHA